MTVSFDKVASIYDATRWAGVPAPIMERILGGMRDLLKDCKSILDVGIGTGRFAQYFNDRGFGVLGIDVSLEMMKQAKAKGVRDLVRADAQHMPFRDESFDGSIMIHVLHLVENWVQVIHEVGRITRKILVSEAGDMQGFSARQRYLELRRNMGYPLNRFNDSEFGLRRIIHPKIVVAAGDYWTDVNAEEEITSFESRKSSVMLGVPGDIHRTIMNQLLKEYEGKILRRHDIPEVVGWDALRLRSYEP